jgi:hypothetical protein
VSRPANKQEQNPKTIHSTTWERMFGNLKHQTTERKRLFVSSLVFFVYIFVHQLSRYLQRTKQNASLQSTNLEEASAALYLSKVSPLEREIGLPTSPTPLKPTIKVVGQPNSGKTTFISSLPQGNFVLAGEEDEGCTSSLVLILLDASKIIPSPLIEPSLLSMAQKGGSKVYICINKADEVCKSKKELLQIYGKVTSQFISVEPPRILFTAFGAAPEETEWSEEFRENETLVKSLVLGLDTTNALQVRVSRLQREIQVLFEAESKRGWFGKRTGPGLTSNRLTTLKDLVDSDLMTEVKCLQNRFPRHFEMAKL